MAEATITPVDGHFQPIADAHEAFNVYAALMRAAVAAPRLMADPRWQSLRDEAFELFSETFWGMS